MSRIGKLPITIPSGVKVAVEPKEVRLEGPKGKLKTTIPPGVQVKVDGNIVRVEREQRAASSSGFAWADAKADRQYGPGCQPGF